MGVVLATVSVYIVEIATTDMRGFLGCFVQFLGSIGVLLTFVIGSYVNWWQLAVVQLLMVIPFMVAMFFIPESPRWLVMKSREKGECGTLFRNVEDDDRILTTSSTPTHARESRGPGGAPQD